MIPIFSSHASLGRSILTVEDDDVSKEGPISILGIAKKHGLKEVYLLDTTFTSFPTAYNAFKKAGINLRFGVRLNVMSDPSDLNPELRNTESKINVWMASSLGYQDLINIYSEANSVSDNFSGKGRISWESLNKMMTPNLKVTIPFYGGFIHRIKFKGAIIIPRFSSFTPAFEIAAMGLPCDELLKLETEEYIQTQCSKAEILNVHYVSYYLENHLKNYILYRITCTPPKGGEKNRKSFSSPNVEELSSNKFSFETYLIKTNGNIIAGNRTAALLQAS